MQLLSNVKFLLNYFLSRRKIVSEFLVDIIRTKNFDKTRSSKSQYLVSQQRMKINALIISFFHYYHEDSTPPSVGKEVQRDTKMTNNTKVPLMKCRGRKYRYE